VRRYNRPDGAATPCEKRYQLATGDYGRLAAFRFALRKFLRFSEDAAAAVA
jgi:hypothetical protein